MEDLPLTLTESPGRYDPERHHEDEQHRPRADGHQSLEDEASVEVDAVQGTDASRWRVCK